jgi:hypothetical protein
LGAAIGDFVDFAQDAELMRLGGRHGQLLIARHRLADDESEGAAVPVARLFKIGNLSAKSDSRRAAITGQGTEHGGFLDNILRTILF